MRCLRQHSAPVAGPRRHAAPCGSVVAPHGARQLARAPGAATDRAERPGAPGRPASARVAARALLTKQPSVQKGADLPQRPLSVCIAGGGIGGLVLAVALLKKGVQVRIAGRPGPAASPGARAKTAGPILNGRLHTSSGTGLPRCAAVTWPTASCRAAAGAAASAAAGFPARRPFHLCFWGGQATPGPAPLQCKWFMFGKQLSLLIPKNFPGRCPPGPPGEWGAAGPPAVLPGGWLMRAGRGALLRRAPTTPTPAATPVLEPCCARHTSAAPSGSSSPPPKKLLRLHKGDRRECIRGLANKQEMTGAGRSCGCERRTHLCCQLGAGTGEKRGWQMQNHQ
jgi:hypothetical protein